MPEDEIINFENGLKSNDNITVQDPENSEENSQIPEADNPIQESTTVESKSASTEVEKLQNIQNDINLKDLNEENPVSESTLIETDSSSTETKELKSSQNKDSKISDTDVPLRESTTDEPNSASPENDINFKDLNVKNPVSESTNIESESSNTQTNELNSENDNPEILDIKISIKEYTTDKLKSPSSEIEKQENNSQNDIDLKDLNVANPVLESTIIEQVVDSTDKEKLQCSQNSQSDVDKNSVYEEPKSFQDFLNESFIVVSECGEDLQENAETPELSENLGFVIDISPIEEKKISSHVPLFKRSRRDVLKEEEAKIEINDAIIRKRNTCFNCNGDHALRDCELPRDMKKINKARKLRNFKTERYHVDAEQRFAHIKPGTISNDLAKALDLRSSEIPPMFYKMRVLGYPPAWLEATKIAHSGITLFGSKGYSVLGSDDDEGELEESKHKYDVTKIISFPGFNTHPGQGYFDDYKYQAVPPFSPNDSKDIYIELFQSNTAKPGYKRRKLNIDVEGNDECVVKNEETIADMDVDDDEIYTTRQNMQLPFYLQHQPPPPPENPPSTPPPPPEDGEIECEEEGKLIDDEGFQDLSLDALQSKQAELLKLLNNSEDKSENSIIMEEIDIKPSTEKENITSEDLENTDKEQLNENVNPDENELSGDNNSNITESKIEIGLLKSSTIGTPLLKFTPYDKLPPGDLFKEGVSDVINFENLPDSTGKYDQMKKLLYKVRKRIIEINQSTDD